MTAALLSGWADLLPDRPGLGEELLARWSEPHRHYHDAGHLSAALSAHADVGGTARPERLALWFHDAVFTGVPVEDEHASAELARRRLGDVLPGEEVAEVARLVLVTIEHHPAVGDHAGARVSDADLAVLGAEPDRYTASVRALRAEAVATPDLRWREQRLARVDHLLRAEPLFHTEPGRRRWLAAARANLAAERLALLHG